MKVALQTNVCPWCGRRIADIAGKTPWNLNRHMGACVMQRPADGGAKEYASDTPTEETATDLPPQ